MNPMEEMMWLYGWIFQVVKLIINTKTEKQQIAEEL